MTDILHKIIDPHLHLFNLQKGDYSWLKLENPPYWPDKQQIHKNFIEADVLLQPPFVLSGFVHIEAGFDNQQPWREIDWLQQHCTLPFKSVAFADLGSQTFASHINKLKQRASVVGIRHILDEQAAQILSLPKINSHFCLLAELGFSFDAQLSLTDDKGVDLLIGLANQHQSVPIIINHGGWPPATTQPVEKAQWNKNLLKLAECQNIAIKLSGWEMSNREWPMQQAINVLKTCLSIFGDTRVMLASNFPLCLLSLPYAKLWQAYAELTEISPACLEKITYLNALNWYKFTELAR